MCSLLLGLWLAAPVQAQDPEPEPLVEEPAVEDTALAGDTGDTGDTAEEEEEEPVRNKRQRRPRRGGDDSRDLTPYYIGIAALLGLWLVSRMAPKKPTAVRRPERHEPLSDDELGRFVFHAVVAADLDEYRDLFLTGGEARQVLGSGAQQYLEERTPKVLEDALVELSVHVPEGALFSGTTRAAELLSIEVRNDRGASRSVPIGTTTQVGAVIRLVTPASLLVDGGSGSA